MTTPKKKTSARKPAAKKPAAKKPAAKKLGPPKAVAPIDVLSLDAAHDVTTPDAGVVSLATHAEALAGTVRTLLAPLAKAKVAAADADRLDGLAALLRAREEAWQLARKATATGSVALCRPPLLTGRNDLYGAIEAFVDDEAAAKELAEIGTVDDDDDLEADTRRLIALSRTHATDLHGTEITPARVDEVEAALAAFRDARKGVVHTAPEGASKQALSEAARVALELRNRAFWALAALDRTVCKRGRFGLRGDPKRRALFNAYITESRRVKKARAPKPPRAQKTP